MGVRASRQLFLIGLALALWSALATQGWVALLACYLVGLCLVDSSTALGLLPELPARTWLALGLVLALPGACFAYRQRTGILEDAGLFGIRERMRDRVRLARTPALAPGLLSSALPQSLFVYAPGASSASVVLDDKVARLPGEALGHGLFRVDYDPRRDGVPGRLDGELEVRVATESAQVQRTLQLVTPLAHPRWFCRSPSGLLAATTSEETDELIVVGQAPLRIPVGDGPAACAFVDDHTIAVSHRYAAELWIVDVSTSPARTRARTVDGTLGPLCFDAARNELVIARLGPAPALLQLTWPGLEAIATTTLQPSADWLALAGDQLIAATRADASLHALRRRPAGFVETARLSLGRPAAALAVDLTGTRVFVSTTDFRPQGGEQLGNHFVQDQLLVVDALRMQVVQSVLTARRSERQTKPGDADQGGSPLGLWPLRDGRLALAFAGTDELWRLRLPEAELQAQRLDSERFFTPHGVVELSDGTLWLASPAAGALAKLPPGASAASVVPLSPSDRALAIRRPAALARRLGERGFYESTRSGIACQSCHMHADSDLGAYNLGDHRATPTLSVRGLFGTAPYLRDGSYSRIADLDEVAQTLYRGYARFQPGRPYTLQAYVESLPREPSRRPRDPAAERRGWDVFMRAGCARCHSPPAFTNLGQLPLSALFPRIAATLPEPETLDVPSLLSIAASAPYLHDGRAKTLSAVLDEENPDNLHGDTRSLSAAQRADLLQFLGSL